MRLRLLAAGAVLAGAVSILVAPAAHANSFSVDVFGGNYSYNDGQDRFCVASKTGTSVSVSLSPVVAGRGPSPSVTARGGATRCVSLATAYEDSQYRAVVIGSNSSHSERYTRTFYS